MSSSHPATLTEQALLAECNITRTRRSGPGGQHRNKVETAIVIKHTPTGVRAEASERRSQAENRKVALFRLRKRLAVEIRSPRSSTTPAAPSSLWQSRCKVGRIKVSPKHDDFPALLAEALDQLDARDHNLTATAHALGITPSQLVRFLQREPSAMSKVNGTRQSRGLCPLR